MDAIESGIVKIPRVPVDDDAAGRPAHLPQPLGQRRPGAPEAQAAKDASSADELGTRPEALEGALESLYRSYERRFARLGERRCAASASRRPCSSSSAPTRSCRSSSSTGSPARRSSSPTATTVRPPATCRCFATSTTATGSTRPRTILVDSAQLESGEPLGADFKKAAAHEIEAFKHEYRLPQPRRRRRQAHRRRPPPRGDEHGRQEGQARRAHPLRRVGVDAHRGLGRQHRHPHPRHPRASAASSSASRSSAAACAAAATPPTTTAASSPSTPSLRRPVRLHPGGRPVDATRSRKPPGRRGPCARRSGRPRDPLPKLDGYRVECLTSRCIADFGARRRLHVDRNEVATLGRDRGHRRRGRRDRPRRVPQRTAAAGRLRDRADASSRSSSTPPTTAPSDHGCSPASSTSPSAGCDEYVTYGPTTPSVGMLLLAASTAPRPPRSSSASRPHYPDSRASVLLPILRRFDPEGSTDEVDFVTRKVVIDPADQVATSTTSCSTAAGQHLGGGPRRHPRAATPTSRAYVKNDHLGFTIPYVHEGRTHHYVPDFLVRLVPEPDDDRAAPSSSRCPAAEEVPGPTAAKADDRPQPVVRRRQQPRRFGPLGLRRDRRRMADAEPDARRRHRRTSTPTSPIIGEPVDAEEPRDAAPQEEAGRPDAGRGDHPRRQARQHPDRRRPGLRRRPSREADAGPLPARPTPRPAARVEGQGRPRRRRPRGRRAADLHPGEDRPAGPGREPPPRRPTAGERRARAHALRDLRRARATSTSSSSTSTTPTGRTA